VQPGTGHLPDFSCRRFVLFFPLFALLCFAGGVPMLLGCAAYMKLFATSHEK
jgi:hypothetical protein